MGRVVDPQCESVCDANGQSVVESLFGWLGRYRRLARDYEHPVASSEAITYLASIRRTLKLVAT